MVYGRMVKVTQPPLFGEGAEREAAVYVVGAENPTEAVILVRNIVAHGSNIEVVGRVSHQLLVAMGVNPNKVTRI
jgi:hypothetical protein